MPYPEEEMPDPTDETSDPEDEMTSSEFLRDLSERLMKVPVMYGVDGWHIDRLREIATDIEKTA